MDKIVKMDCTTCFGTFQVMFLESNSLQSQRASVRLAVKVVNLGETLHDLNPLMKLRYIS